MLGVVVQLIISWLLVWLFERKGLSVLGLFPTRERAQNFIFGLIASAITCAVYFLAVGYASEGSWIANDDFSFQSLLHGLWWNLTSVLFEELIFRGVLLYIAIKRLGLTTGCVISAVCFGIYHWFSYNVFGDIVQMSITFIVTGIAGLMFAFAYGITKSVYLPIALHYGYNFTANVIFSNGPLGEQLLILRNGHLLSGMISIVASVFQMLALPILMLWYLSRVRQSQLSESKN